MAWTVPMTFVDNTVLTSAQLNTHLRDNFLETVPAKSTGNGGIGGGIFTVQGPYQLAERGIAYEAINIAQTTTSNNYDDLATFGPSVSVHTGTHAWVLYSVELWSSVWGVDVTAAVEVTGATEKPAGDDTCIQAQSGANSRCSRFRSVFYTDLTPGMNIFTLKYKMHGDDGNGGFDRRHLWVFPF